MKKYNYKDLLNFFLENKLSYLESLNLINQLPKGTEKDDIGDIIIYNSAYELVNNYIKTHQNEIDDLIKKILLNEAFKDDINEYITSLKNCYYLDSGKIVIIYFDYLW